MKGSEENKKNTINTKITFIYYSLKSFIKKDLEILRKHFDVKPIQWRGKRDLPKIALGASNLQKGDCYESDNVSK